jgi:NTP pyrophosphatase (non-canonical NTP hydrolase)
MKTNLNQIAKELHESAIKKGFWENKKETGTLLMLIVSELSEALEADRKNHHADIATFENCQNADDILENDKEYYINQSFQAWIKDSFEDEIADTFIRLFDLVGYLGIDLDKHIELKMQYNQTRKYKHGKAY